MEISAMSLLEIWDLFSDHIPPARKNDAAIKFLEILLDNEIDLDDLEDLRGEDDTIDVALDHLNNTSLQDEEEGSDYED
jgi:hypothetical protein